MIVTLISVLTLSACDNDAGNLENPDVEQSEGSQESGDKSIKSRTSYSLYRLIIVHRQKRTAARPRETTVDSVDSVPLI